jgi:alpha-N-arabinofuranosidase
VKVAGNYLDYISVHLYADRLNQVDKPSDFDACMARTMLADEIIDAAEEAIAVAGFAGKVKIAFDEWNLRGWHHPSAGNPFRLDVAARDRNDINATYTMADALYTACFLNTCLRHSDSVRMANMAPVVNTRGPLYVHSEGIVKRTSFHVMQMYANLMQPNVVDVSVDSANLAAPAVTFRDAAIALGAASKPYWYTSGRVKIQALDVVATCDDAAFEWSIAVVNRHATDTISCVLSLGMRLFTGDVEVVVLSGPDVDAYNDVNAPDRVVPEAFRISVKNGAVEFPPHSLTVIMLNIGTSQSG